MQAAPPFRKPPNRDVLLKSVPPVQKCSCRDLRRKLDCQFRTLGEVTPHLTPKHPISWASPMFTDAPLVPEFY